MEDNIQYVFILIMAALDLVLISRLRSRIREERKNIAGCEKMSALIGSVSSERIPSSRAFAPGNMLYTFVVKADNGCIYKVRSNSGTAPALKAGDTVDILVPEGAAALVQDNEHFESIIRGGDQAIASLSHEEKVRLNAYLDQKLRSGTDTMYDLLNNNAPSLASDGRGHKPDIITLGAFTAVVSFFIVAFFVLNVFHR